MSRSCSSATITFGLVSIPVKFYLYAQAEEIHFNMITDNGNRVNQILIDSITGEKVDRAKLQKGFEYSKGNFIIFTKEEIKSLETDEKNIVEIKEFINISNVDYARVEKTYHLDAGKGGDKAYRLFVAALKKKKKVAVAQWSNRGKQHLIFIAEKNNSLIVYQLFYDYEIREFSPDCATYNPSDAEINMACKLINSLSSDSFDSSKYKNNQREKLIEKIEERKLAKPVSSEEISKGTQVFDLFAALEKSLKVMGVEKVS